MNNLHILFISLNTYQYKQIILVGDFNLFLDTPLEARVGFPCLIKREICSKINWLIYLIFQSLEILIRNDFVYDLYEHEEFFFNIGKKHGNQNQTCNLIFEEKKIDEEVAILNKIKSLYETPLKIWSPKNVS